MVGGAVRVSGNANHFPDLKPVFPLQRQRPGNDWHKWFAWYPVWVEGERVWLRRVERIGIRYGGHTFYSYRRCRQ